MDLEIDRAKYDSAIKSLDGTNNSRVSHEEADFLYTVLLGIPELADRGDALGGPEQPNSLEAWSRQTPLATFAFDYANLSLACASDALRTLAVLILKSGVITQLGPHALVRQASESAVFASWCLAEHDPTAIVSRGLAARWEDLTREEEFVREFPRSEPRPRTDQMLRLREQARAQRLLTSKGKPLLHVPLWTKLFSDYAWGQGNLLWYYRLLSGASHGRAWAQLGLTQRKEVLEHLRLDEAGNRVPSGVVLMRSNPNVEALGLTVAIATGLVREAMDRYDAARLAPAPGIPGG